MLTAREIRASFKTFFKSKGHQIVPSAPMVIKGDPTLMFTNAGMNQFKDIILGNVPIKYTRVADSQKCLRVSGKHNDLEEVGHDTYHHTMFEMLGNWSFGDYFKHEAIDFCWEYLVNVLGLNPDRLYATVFEGYAPEDLERDNEAAGYWESHLPKSHIINGDKHDNFWEMGDTGPCGPCSEVHIDLRSDEERKAISGAEMVNKDHPQVIEIWNLVFMQYNRKSNYSLEALPARVIDTGMGFERLCMALQGKTSNYDTDVFQPIIQAIATLAGARYGEDNKKDIAMRVIADHIRTIAFAITDGQLPSNAKAGYVIRRILRRAVRYGYTFLGRREAFLYRLLPVLIETMGDAYPELIAQKELINNVIKEEEDAFLRTLDTGIRLLDKCIEDTRKTGKTQMDGKTAFTLYDTYGFPLDLTELILRENQMTVDVKQFDAEMKKQKERARNAAVIETGDWIILKEGNSKFVGYDVFHCDCEILRYRQIKQKKKTLYQIVLDKTPFYAEMGGQVGDSGWLINEQEKVEVIDVKRENNLPVHILKKLPQDLTASFTAQINEEKRIQSECNHSATHLLHKALRLTLGEHVEQKGSFVSPDTLRFDFSHFQKVSTEELRKVECLINEMIRADYPLEEHRSVPIAEAEQMGAIALFGEKYGEEVRVIKYGDSIELCGGTHIPSTGRIGSLRIVSESSVAAGVRRIEAVTAKNADRIYYKQQDFLADIRALFNNVPDLKQTLVKAIDENAELKKQLAVVEKEKAIQLKKKIQAEVTEKNGIKRFVYMGQARPNDIKDIAFQIKGETQEDFIFVAGTLTIDKCQLTVMLSEGLIEQGLHAGKMVKTAATHIKGGGGGQPHFATAGGKDPKGISAAINTVLETAGLL